MAHTVQIQELINGIQITETVDAEVVVKLLSYQGKPFFRTTNETDEETYQIIDKVGEIYNLPALATEFVLIDLNDTVYIPANGEELIEYSVKLKPFRGDTEPDEAHTGIIETTANSVTINLPGDDVNWAKINGSFYERYYPDTFNFTPVTANQKILIIYAIPDELPFRLAQGIESAEAIEPDYNGLFIARIIVNTVGEVVEEEDNGFKVRSEDGWRTINNSTAAFIALGNNPAGSFHLTGSSDVQGFITKQGKFLWPGREFVIKTDLAVTLKASTFIDTSNARHWTFAEDFALKADSWAIIKEKGGELLVIEMGVDVDLYIHSIAITTTTSITTDTADASGRVQNGREVAIKNGVNAINLTCELSSPANFVASYTKEGSASITVLAGAGATLYQTDGTNIINGIKGSTFCIKRSGNEFQLQISNR